jgi:hypothetical protein
LSTIWPTDVDVPGLDGAALKTYAARIVTRAERVAMTA